jgi:hypothetical protein
VALFTAFDKGKGYEASVLEVICVVGKGEEICLFVKDSCIDVTGVCVLYNKQHKTQKKETRTTF